MARTRVGRLCGLRIAKGTNVLASSHMLVHGTHASVTLSSGKSLSLGQLHAAHRHRHTGWRERLDQTVKLG